MFGVEVAECGVGEPGVGDGVGQGGGEVYVFGDVVEVEGDKRAGEDVAFAAPAVFEVAAYEAAYVFVLVAFCLGHAAVLIFGAVDDGGLVGAGGEVLEGGVLVGPVGGGAGGGGGDFEFAVFHWWFLLHGLGGFGYKKRPRGVCGAWWLGLVSLCWCDLALCDFVAFVWWVDVV